MACNAWGSASFSFKSSPGRTEISRGSTLLPFFTCSHMRLFSMVDFPMPWEPLTTKKEGVLKALRWGELMKSLMYSSSTSRAGAGSVLSSLCPAFLTALFMKKPGRNLWMRAWRTSTTKLPVLNNVQPVLTVCAGKALAGCVRRWPLGRTNRPGTSSTCLTKMHLRNVEGKGQYIVQSICAKLALVLKDAWYANTKQEPQRLTSINTWIWSKSFDIFEQQLGRVWTWTYT